MFFFFLFSHNIPIQTNKSCTDISPPITTIFLLSFSPVLMVCKGQFQVTCLTLRNSTLPPFHTHPNFFIAYDDNNVKKN
eukprot:UN00494